MWVYILCDKGKDDTSQEAFRLDNTFQNPKLNGNYNKSVSKPVTTIKKNLLSKPHRNKGSTAIKGNFT